MAAEAAPNWLRGALLPVRSAPSANGATAGQEMVDDQHDDGTDHRHEHAVDVEAGHARRPELVEQKAADHRADDAEDDVEQQALALAVDDLAGDEAGDQTEHDPADDRHALSFSARPFRGGRSRGTGAGQGRAGCRPCKPAGRPRSGDPAPASYPAASPGPSSG